MTRRKVHHDAKIFPAARQFQDSIRNSGFRAQDGSIWFGEVHDKLALEVNAFSAETAACGVTVNAVCPRYTDTDLVRDSIRRVAAKTGRAQAEVLAEYERDAPIGRLIRPEEVAAAVLYLCSSEAAAVTGTTLAIAGGEM